MAASLIALVTGALETLKLAIPLLPTYTQKQEKDYEELLLAFKREITTETPDLRELSELIDKLLCHVEAIRSQVGRK